MRHDESMVQAWQICVAFNNRHEVGSKVIRLDPETSQKQLILTTSPAHVVNDTPVVASDNKVYKLAQLVY